MAFFSSVGERKWSWSVLHFVCSVFQGTITYQNNCIFVYFATYYSLFFHNANSGNMLSLTMWIWVNYKGWKRLENANSTKIKIRCDWLDWKKLFYTHKQLLMVSNRWIFFTIEVSMNKQWLEKVIQIYSNWSSYSVLTHVYNCMLSCVCTSTVCRQYEDSHF